VADGILSGGAPSPAVPAGGTLADANVRAEFWAGSMFSVTAMAQYEMWNYPVIDLTRQSNVTSMIELSFWPKALWMRNESDRQ